MECACRITEKRLSVFYYSYNNRKHTFCAVLESDDGEVSFFELDDKAVRSLIISKQICVKREHFY